MVAAMFGAVVPLTLALAAPTAPAGPPPTLSFPLACRTGVSCEVQNYVDRDPGPGARDYRCGRETYQGHKGVDIRLLDMAAQKRGVNVLAAAPGVVSRMRDGMEDISIRAPVAPSVAGQECGNGLIIDHGGGWTTQYCHMAKGSLVVKPGQKVQAGTVLGRVGLSGQTEFPHLHIQVARNGQVVDPFDPDMADAGGCQAKGPLWSPAALAQLGYKQGAVLNAGFAGGPVKMEDVEGGAISPPGRDAAYLVAYVRATELQAGDVISMSLTAPDGRSLAQSQLPPLGGFQAQHVALIGKKKPPAGWPAGVYKASYRVLRQGKAVVSHSWQVRIG